MVFLSILERNSAKVTSFSSQPKQYETLKIEVLRYNFSNIQQRNRGDAETISRASKMETGINSIASH